MMALILYIDHMRDAICAIENERAILQLQVLQS